MHRPGNTNLTNGPSRRADYAPSTEIFLVKEFLRFASTAVPILLRDDLIQALTADPLTVDLAEENLTDAHSTWEWDADYLFHNNKIYIPETLRNCILQQCHDAVVSDHYSQRRTYAKIAHSYY